MKRLIALLCLISGNCFACTDFILTDENKDCVVGRSMEFAVDLKSEIVFVERGPIQITKIGNKEAFSWRRKHSFLGLTALGIDKLIVDGVNEVGLSIGFLWLPGTEYPKIPANKLNQTIPLENLGGWILSTCATVEEVKKILPQVYIKGDNLPEINQIPPLHISIHDRSGKSIVVEFIKGKIEISDNPVGVLTNDPTFDWQVTNLRNYINLVAQNAASQTIEGVEILPTGQGTGMRGLPGDWTPPSRFVKIALQKTNVQQAKTSDANVNLAFHLLNTVDIPLGVIKDSSGKNSDYTQWIVVKDLKNCALYFRTYDNQNIGMVTLEDSLQKGVKNVSLNTPQ